MAVRSSIAHATPRTPVARLGPLALTAVLSVVIAACSNVTTVTPPIPTLTQTPLATASPAATVSATNEPQATVHITTEPTSSTEASPTPMQTQTPDASPSVEPSTQPGSPEATLQAITDKLQHPTPFSAQWYDGPLGFDAAAGILSKGDSWSSYDLFSTYLDSQGRVGIAVWLTNPKTGAAYVEVKQVGVPGAKMVFGYANDMNEGLAWEHIGQTPLTYTPESAYPQIGKASIHESLVSVVNTNGHPDYYLSPYMPAETSHLDASIAVRDFEISLAKGKTPASLPPGVFDAESIPDQLPNLDDVSLVLALII